MTLRQGKGSILAPVRTRVTIGDFSRASHLSVKTLRHYDEVGLLEPSEVDPDNGYRYYSEDQIPLAQVIRGPAGGVSTSEIFQHSRGQATVFIPTDRIVKPIGRVVSLLIPAAELAVTRHHGPLSDIDVTYGKLGAYVIKHEISVDGPLRENYLRGIACQ